MREHDRRYMPRTIEDSQTDLRFDFCIDPKKSSYNSDNCHCSIYISYRSGDDYDYEGGINRKYTRKVAISYGQGEVTLQTLEVRENFIKTLAMIVEMIETVTPPFIIATVKTAAEIADNKARQEEQAMGSKIFASVGWDAIKGIRKGKNPRVVRLPDNFVESFGSMPSEGTYRYVQIRRTLRRGVVREKADYLFKVTATDANSRIVSIYRTA